MGGVTPTITIIQPYAKIRPIVFDNDNTSLYLAQAEAVHARYAFLRAPDIYGPPSAGAQPDSRAFNGGQVIVPPQTAST